MRWSVLFLDTVVSGRDTRIEMYSPWPQKNQINLWERREVENRQSKHNLE